jgi:O-acetyl-ADP-ribose deacetylase (regulator of RNase III)
MKWIKDALADAKAILLAPITNVLCIAGIVLVAVAFIDYDKVSGLALHGQVHMGPAVVGLVLILIGTLLFYMTGGVRRTAVRLGHTKCIQIKKGQLTIRVQIGEIQSISDATRTSAIILPANTTFVDDCATDKRTAMGAFFLDRFPEMVATLPAVFEKELESLGLHADVHGQFAPGTTIILPEAFAKPAKVVVTAATTRMAGAGMASNPCIICSCVEGVLKSTADQRVDTLFLPILGSGHGGVDRGMALLFLVLAILHFTKSYHHVTLAQIVVHPRDVDGLNQSKELSQIAAL